MADANLVTTIFDRGMFLVLPFLVGIFALFALIHIAPMIGLVDKPTMRKNHSGHIPLVGGIAIFSAIAFSAVLLVPQFEVKVFLISATAIMCLGVADDFFDLSAGFRLVVQFGVAIYMASYAGVYIENIGNIFGQGPIRFEGYIGLVFTALCAIGVINSINMIDGVDGLAGSILAISFTGMAILAWNNGSLVSAKLNVIFVGAIAAFLVLNARIFTNRARVFLGDSGSMLLGLIMVWFLIRLSQGDNAAVSPVLAGWVFGLPLIDTISVMMRRVIAGKSPFAAGRDHLHHRLLDAGYSVNQTVAIESTIHSGFVVFAIVGNQFMQFEPVMFWVFVSSIVLHFAATPSIIQKFRTPTNAI